jgi:uncharacterized protein YkwD
MTPQRRTCTKIALAVAILTSLSALAPSPASAATLTPRAKMYRATNHSRVYNGVRRVDIHYQISKLARKHSISMANKGYIFHTSTSMIQGTYLKGINWRTWGENVGVTGGTIAGLQDAFMHSTGHRANILNRGFRRVAVGTYRDDDGLLWVTVFFYG